MINKFINEVFNKPERCLKLTILLSFIGLIQTGLIKLFSSNLNQGRIHHLNFTIGVFTSGVILASLGLLIINKNMPQYKTFSK